MIFAILLHRAGGEPEGHDKENEPCDLEPQLVSGAPDGTTGGAYAAYHGAEGAVASGLPPGDLRYNP